MKDLFRYFCILFSEKHSFKKLLFKLPKKLELSKDESIDQKKYVVNWQDKDKIGTELKPAWFQKE